jgi:hypothetical protein
MMQVKNSETSTKRPALEGLYTGRGGGPCSESLCGHRDNIHIDFIYTAYSTITDTSTKRPTVRERKTP